MTRRVVGAFAVLWLAALVAWVVRFTPPARIRLPLPDLRPTLARLERMEWVAVKHEIVVRDYRLAVKGDRK